MAYSRVAHDESWMGGRIVGCWVCHTLLFPSSSRLAAEKGCWERRKWLMDVLPFISILVILFAITLITETIRLKKEVRKIGRLNKHMRKDIEMLKEKFNDK